MQIVLWRLRRKAFVCIHIQLPLENFYTEAICLDLSHVDLKHDISVDEVKAALEKSGERILPGDTVLIHMGLNERLDGQEAWQHDFPGLDVDAVHWLADQGIRMFGVEAVSPATEGEGNWQAHIACAERGLLCFVQHFVFMRL